jgi:hypothetical protein
MPRVDRVDSPPGRKSNVYVLRRHIGGRPVIEPETVFARALILAHYDEISRGIPEMRRRFDAQEQANSSEGQRLAAWGQTFIDACDLSPDGPWPTRRRGRWAYDWTTADGRRHQDVSLAMVSLRAVHRAGPAGVTANEVKQSTGIVSDGIGGVLSFLDQALVVARLVERR